jgi:hypothetical protein
MARLCAQPAQCAMFSFCALCSHRHMGALEFFRRGFCCAMPSMCQQPMRNALSAAGAGYYAAMPRSRGPEAVAPSSSTTAPESSTTPAPTPMRSISQLSKSTKMGVNRSPSGGGRTGANTLRLSGGQDAKPSPTRNPNKARQSPLSYSPGAGGGICGRAATGRGRYLATWRCLSPP